MLSMYKATLRFTTDAVESKYFAMSTKAGRTMLDAMGAAAPAAETMNVIVHFVFRG